MAVTMALIQSRHDIFFGSVPWMVCKCVMCIFTSSPLSNQHTRLLRSDVHTCIIYDLDEKSLISHGFSPKKKKVSTYIYGYLYDDTQCCGYIIHVGRCGFRQYVILMFLRTYRKTTLFCMPH